MWRAERTEQLHRDLMQITEDRSGALEPRGDLVDPASGIVGQGRARRLRVNNDRSEEHTSELQSLRHLVCRLLLEKKKNMRSSLKDPEHKQKYHYVRIPRSREARPSTS